MKQVFLAGVVAVLVLLSQGAALGQSYTLQVANQGVVGTEFFFDIYLLRTGVTELYLGNSDFALTFNSVNFTSPVASKVSSDAQLSTWYSVSPAIVSGDRCVVSVAPPPLDDPLQVPVRTLNVSATGLGSLIARVKITGVSNPAGTAGLVWRNDGSNVTSVSSINPVTLNELAVTNPAWHVAPGDQPLPVTLTSFTALIVPSASGVRLEWKTSSEVNNYGYTVQRKGEGDPDFTDLPGAFVAGKGTTVEPQAYSYVDGSVAKAGSYSYRLKQQDLDGTVHYTQSVNINVMVTDVAEAAPKVFQLMQNYPNPFNPSTQVKFSVETTGKATVKVYNMVGEQVATLFDGTAEAGRYYVATFDASRLATGIYFYRITTEKKNDVKKMLLVK